MDMAHVPTTTTRKSVSPTDERFKEALADAIHAGKRPAEIARAMAPHDAQRRKVIRARVRNMLYEDEALAGHLAKRAKMEFLIGLGPASRALAGRASRGRVDAIKLLFEASGFHNPRVQHEHSGDIKISLTIPRPDREPKAIEATAVEDAEVVE